MAVSILLMVLKQSYSQQEIMALKCGPFLFALAEMPELSQEDLEKCKRERGTQQDCHIRTVLFLSSMPPQRHHLLPVAPEHMANVMNQTFVVLSLLAEVELRGPSHSHPQLVSLRPVLLKPALVHGWE